MIPTRPSQAQQGELAADRRGRPVARLGRPCLPLLCVLLACAPDREERVPLDFTQLDAVVEAAPTDLVLRVAVSAMTSPQETFHLYNDLMDHIGKRTGRRIQFVQRRTYAEVNDLLLRDELDLAFICTGAWVDLEPSGQVELLAVPQIRGQATYRSYLVVPRDSPAAALQDFSRARFAFTDSLSLTGCWHVRDALARRGLRPEVYFSTWSTPMAMTAPSGPWRKVWWTVPAWTG